MPFRNSDLHYGATSTHHHPFRTTQTYSKSPYSVSLRPTGLLSDPFPTDQNYVRFSSLPCLLHAPPISLPWLDHPNNDWWKIRSTNFFMQYPLSCIYSFRLNYMIFSSASCLQKFFTLILCAFLRVWDKVFHSCKTTSKIIFKFTFVGWSDEEISILFSYVPCFVTNLRVTTRNAFWLYDI